MKWKFPVKKQIFSSPAVAGGVVYIHVRDDHVYALDAGDGTLVWKTLAPSPQKFWDPVFMDPSKSSPAVDGTRVYLGIHRELTALDRRTGKVLWKAETGRKVDSTPLIVGETVYVGSDDKNFYAFEAATGKKIWSYGTKGRVSSSPNYGEGLILIGSNDGFLYAFEEVSKEASPQR